MATMTADDALTLTRKLYRKLAARREFAREMDHAYRGRHKLHFATDKWREYHEKRYRNFSDNWCAPVANSPAERLRVTGFRLDNDPSQSDAEKSLWRDWQANEMDAQSSQGFLASIIAGRSSVLVWGDDDDGPLITWEHPAETYVEHDPERPRLRTAALKTWCDDDMEFATLYTPDEVFKWQRRRVEQHRLPDDLPPAAEAFFSTPAGIIVPTVEDDGWAPRKPDTDNTWPLPNPLGVVPIVEFPNRPMLGGEPLSDIAGTLAMQHAINLLWAYLFTAADHASMPARVVMGQEPPKLPILDENGDKVGEKTVDIKKLAEDRILWLTGENTKIGQWEAARLDVFTGVVETAVTHIAAQTRTPPHYLVLGKGMVNVNAEGMKAAETGLVMKCGEEQLFFTPPIREVFRLTALSRGDEGLAEKCRQGTVQWKDAENRSQAQLVDSLLKLQSIGFPFAWIAEQYGLSDTALDRVLDMRLTEAEQDPVGMLSRQMGQQLPAAPAEDGSGP